MINDLYIHSPSSHNDLSSRRENRMPRLFESNPCFCFLKQCIDCLAEHPDRTTHEILRDLSKLASLIERATEPDSRFQLELIRCRLKRDLLQQVPIFTDDKVECSNVGGDNPVNLRKFLAEWLGPLIEFFGAVKVLSLNSLQVKSVNDEDAAALVEFIERLKTLNNLKEIRVSFLSLKSFVNAVEIGLDRLAFVKLSVKIETFQNQGYDSLAAVLARGIKIDDLHLSEGYIFNSGKPLDETLAFFANLDSLKVTCYFSLRVNSV